MNEVICTTCSAPLESKTIMVMGIAKEIFKPCPCQTAKKQAEERKLIEMGRAALVERWKTEAGLKKRQKQQTFASFTPDAGQQAAYDMALQFANELPETGLLLSGSVGSGKTHLAVAVINHIIDNREISDKRAMQEVDGFLMVQRDPSLQFISTVDMLANIKKTYDTGEDTQAIINRYAHAKLLVLDDVGTEKQTEWANERLFEVIDHRYNELLPTICTTNATPAELKERLGDRVFDRIRSMCKLVPVESKSHRVTA